MIQETISQDCTQSQACSAIGLSERTLQRWRKSPAGDLRQGPMNHSRKLLKVEVEQVISIACSEEFVDLTPALIVATLADQGRYVASESTFYRLLRGENLLAHRSRSKPPQPRVPVETIASQPNQVWNWDITNLSSLTRGFFTNSIYLKIFIVVKLWVGMC